MRIKIKQACVYTVLIILLGNSSLSQDQSFKRPATLGIDFILNDYSTGIRHGKLNKFIPNNISPGVAVNYTQGLTRQYNLSIMIAGSFTDSLKKYSRLPDKHLQLQASAIINLNLVTDPSRIQPFISSGIGVETLNSYYGCFIPAGAGLQTSIGKYLYSTLNVQYRLGIASTIPSHFFYSIGLAGILPRRTERKKNAPLLVLNDHEQNIQDFAPDKDHDGIPDKADACPEQAGVLENKGCPDQKKRSEELKSIQQNTLPNNPDKTSIAEMLDSLARNILFETNSHLLKVTSYASLNKAYGILTANPQLSIKIEGHTDDIGTDFDNMGLSQKRAKEVVNFFVSKGINSSRLTAIGYGETKPKYDNLSNESRAANRRVEFKVSFFDLR